MADFGFRAIDRCDLPTGVTTASKLVSIVQGASIVRPRDLAKYRIHPEVLKRAAQSGLIVKVGRGIYTREDFAMDIDRQILLAVKRVPHGVVCLESALMFHRLLPTSAGPIWRAIHPKARKPVVNGQLLRFVRFGGDAWTQGVINTRVDGVSIRVYSRAKTVADCLKYRKKIRANLAIQILEEYISQKSCSLERLQHFAKICRVRKLVHAASYRPQISGGSLKWFLSIFSDLIFDSSVNRECPTWPQPVGPNTRPRLAFRASSIMLFSHGSHPGVCECIRLVSPAWARVSFHK